MDSVKKDPMNEILVSVIVPVYNAEKYIDRCVTSILNQTHANFELLLVVDGATDHSAEICHALRIRDARIILIEKEHEGVSAARNLGIQRAKGDYLCFVDSDDSIACDYLESLLAAITDNDAQIALCHYCFERDGKFSPSGEADLPSCDLEKDSIYTCYIQPFFRIDSTPYIMGSACRSMFQKALLWNKDIRFPPCNLYEDQLFMLEAMTACTRIASLNRAMYYYNDAVVDSAIRRKYKSNLPADQHVYLEHLQELLRKTLTATQQETVYHYALRSARKLLLTNACMHPDRAMGKEERKQIRASRICTSRIPRRTDFRWLRAQPLKTACVEVLLRLRLYGMVRWLRSR